MVRRTGAPLQCCKPRTTGTERHWLWGDQCYRSGHLSFRGRLTRNKTISYTGLLSVMYLPFASGFSNKKGDEMTFFTGQTPEKLSLMEPESNNAVAMSVW